MHAANPCAQRFGGHFHAPVLLSVVVLAQFKAVLICKIDQVLAAFLKQSTIRGVRNCFGHATFTRGVDADQQQRFHAFFANAFSPAGQARRINGWFMLRN